jgi:hypothetical protein
LISQRPFSPRLAKVVMRDVSTPQSGSVTPKHIISLPCASSGRYLRFISGDPWWITGLGGKTKYWYAEQALKLPGEAPISLRIVPASVIPRPMPPYSSGISRPSQPPSANALMNSHG